jgi:outer membrane lipoprotein carrier protein
MKNASRTARPYLLSFLAALLLSAGIATAQTVEAQPTGAQTPDGQSPDALIRRLEAKYNGGQALQAAFTRTLSQGGQMNSLSGTLTLQGDRYRVETGRQTLVTNGETTWIYTPARGQVLVNDYVEDETAFSPSHFFDGYRERYRVAGVRTAQRDGAERDGAEHRVLTLEPKEPGAFFREVTLWMRASDAVITRLTVEDANASTMTFTLRDVSFGVPTSASTFRFDAPQSAEVVDLRS